MELAKQISILFLIFFSVELLLWRHLCCYVVLKPDKFITIFNNNYFSGSFEEDTTLPKGLESWNESKEDENTETDNTDTKTTEKQ